MLIGGSQLTWDTLYILHVNIYTFFWAVPASLFQCPFRASENDSVRDMARPRAVRNGAGPVEFDEHLRVLCVD